MTRFDCRSAVAAAVLGVAVIGAADAATVSVFLDPAFVDTTEEGANMVADLTALGLTVNTFTGTTAADFTAATAGAVALIFPEMERADLNSALDAAARTALANYVSGGGNMIQANYFFGNSSLPNALFGWSLDETGSHSGALNLDVAEAAGTVFSAAPAILPGLDAVQLVATASLPAGAFNLYHSSADTAVFAASVESGCYTSIGYDWFEGPDGSWRDLLGRAVLNSRCGTPVPEPGTLLLVALSGLGLGFVRRARIV